MDHQDWDTIYMSMNKELKKKELKEKELKGKGKPIVSKAMRLEKQVEDGNLKHKKTDKSTSQSIQQMRMNKGWTQKQLAQKINVTVAVINEIETGKAKHNPQVIQRLKRLLG